MIKNYLLTALRNMRRYALFTVINVTGLSIGLAICMLIIMVVSFQLEADRYNSKSDRIFRVITDRVDNPDLFSKYATVALPVAEALKEDHAAVKNVVRMRRGFGNSWVGDLDDPTIPVSGFFADPGFLQLFEINLSAGDPSTALRDPFSVILTASTAKKLYGEEDPIGKELDMDDKGIYKVTGVIEAQSDRITHLSFEAVASMASATSLEADSVLGSDLNSWDNTTAGWVYMELNDQNAKPDVELYLKKLSDEHYVKDEKVYYAYLLQGLTEIKPGPFMGNEIGPFMPWLFVYILSGLGLIILGSSCFNYINLTIARSMNRTREVGVRKVSGASRQQVFAQFIVESILLCLVAFGLATIFLIILEPAFAQLNFATILQWQLSYSPWVWGTMLLFTIIVGIIAGLFPAMTMSAFRPIDIFKDMRQSKIFSKVFLRKALIVVQFSLSLVFIITIIILYTQVNMMMNADLGYNASSIINIPLNNEKVDVITNELMEDPSVVSVSNVSHLPATGNSYGATFKKDPSAENESMNYFAVDTSYLGTMDLTLLAGRNLNHRLVDQPESEVLMNEAAIKYLGYKNPYDALGTVVYTEDTTALSIVGVIPDYHHEALVMSIKPLVLRIIPDTYNFMQIRAADGQATEVLALAEKVWKKHSPGKLGRFEFLSDKIAEFYNLLFGDLMGILMVIAVIASFIACLGLLGITIFTTELKVKEIGIRKVLGAGSSQLFLHVIKGFLLLIGVSVFIAIPVSWFINATWLELMAYRIDLNPLYFITGALSLVLVAVLTVGSQVFRIIRINPAITLRSD